MFIIYFASKRCEFWYKNGWIQLIEEALSDSDFSISASEPDNESYEPDVSSSNESSNVPISSSGLKTTIWLQTGIQLQVIIKNILHINTITCYQFRYNQILVLNHYTIVNYFYYRCIGMYGLGDKQECWTIFKK